MSVAAAFERIDADERFQRYSDTARALCAIALADGRPLRPGSSRTDAEVLVLAELDVHHGAGARAALESARRRTIVDAELRGAVRYAASRFATDSGLSIRELSREQCVEEATRLFCRQADSPLAERELLRQLEELSRPEPEPFIDGPILGGCHRCGAPVCEGGPTIGLYYLVAGRGRSPGRHEWRSFSPAVERGHYEPRAMQQKRARAERRSELLKQARAGATPLLCLGCATRARLKLIPWPEVEELEDAVDPEALGGDHRSILHGLGRRGR
jgi:hypothetical protein